MEQSLDEHRVNHNKKVEIQWNGSENAWFSEVGTTSTNVCWSSERRKDSQWRTERDESVESWWRKVSKQQNKNSTNNYCKYKCSEDNGERSCDEADQGRTEERRELEPEKEKGNHAKEDDEVFEAEEDEKEARRRRGKNSKNTKQTNKNNQTVKT